MSASGPTAADWLTAIGTIATAALALFLAARDQITRWLFQAKLDVSVKQGPPDCTTIQATGLVQFGQHGAVPFQENQFYCRLSVDNSGNRRASNVAVRAMRLWRADGTKWTEDATFFPLNLKWSHLGATVVGDLDPALPRHCDLCHCTQNVPDRFHLETEVEPNEVAPDVYPTIKPPGRYRLAIGITASDAAARYAIIELNADGGWSDDAAVMATTHLVPAVLKQGAKPYVKPD